MSDVTLSYHAPRPAAMPFAEWIASALEIQGAVLFLPGAGLFLIGTVVALNLFVSEPATLLVWLLVVTSPMLFGGGLMISGMALRDGEPWAPAVAGSFLMLLALPFLLQACFLLAHWLTGAGPVYLALLLIDGTVVAIESILLTGLVHGYMTRRA